MRAALRADPGNDRARLLLAASLSDLDETALALETLDAVDASGSFGPAAADARVTVLADAGHDARALAAAAALAERSEEHTSELQALMRTSYAVICLKKKRRTSV